jgi:hypothetical protein
MAIDPIRPARFYLAQNRAADKENPGDIFYGFIV